MTPVTTPLTTPLTRVNASGCALAPVLAHGRAGNMPVLTWPPHSAAAGPAARPPCTHDNNTNLPGVLDLIPCRANGGRT